MYKLYKFLSYISRYYISIFTIQFIYFLIYIVQDDAASNILNEVIKNDNLSKLEKEMKLEAEKSILCAAKLIAPVIEDTLTAGFAW